MSEQREGGTTTTLEEVFLSREFGQASAPPSSALASVVAVVGNTVVSVGMTVTSTASQIGSALPAVAPVTGVLAASAPL
jgi:hypothetical protein